MSGKIETAVRLYIDTNIFIGAFENHINDLVDLFISEPKNGPTLFTSELTLAELLVKPMKDRNDGLVDVYRSWTVSNDVLEVGPVSRDALYYAAVLKSNYKWLKLPDAIHVSTTIGFDCSHFVSFDQHLERVGEIVHLRHGFAKRKQAPVYLSPATQDFTGIVSELMR